MPPERKDPLEALCPWAGGFWTIPEEFAMLYAVLILVAGYLAFLVWERRVNERAHRSFRAVIHVNGIRGKTSVCRMIDAICGVPDCAFSRRPPAPRPASSAWTVRSMRLNGIRPRISGNSLR